MSSTAKQKKWIKEYFSSIGWKKPQISALLKVDAKKGELVLKQAQKMHLSEIRAIRRTLVSANVVFAKIHKKIPNSSEAIIYNSLVTLKRFLESYLLRFNQMIKEQATLRKRIKAVA